MATIVYLKAGERPPKGRDWFLVRRDLKGRFTVSGAAALQHSAAFLKTPGSGDDLAPALAAATELADVRGVPTVYVETGRAT